MNKSDQFLSKVEEALLSWNGYIHHMDMEDKHIMNSQAKGSLDKWFDLTEEALKRLQSK